MQDSSLQKKVFSSMLWRFGERILAQGVTFVVSVVLARLLTPEDYGNVALLMIFIDLMEVFVVHGFASALVQKKNADNVDFSSVFYFSLTITAVLYLVAFFCAPWLGVAFGSNSLVALFRVLALRLPLSGINSVQHAYVQKQMIFKKYFISTVGSTLFSAAVGIAFALLGYGAWAIVAQYLASAMGTTILLWFSVKWRPQRSFSFARIKQLLGFGWKMLLSQLIHVIYNRLSSFVIGSTYSAADLAYYEQGAKIPGIVETNIDTTINSVLFPAMAKVQEDRDKLKGMVRRSVKMGAMIVWPLMMGLLVLATPIVNLVYTEKWLPCVLFMQIACVRLAMEPIQTANLQAIKALGRSDLYVKMEIVKKAYGICIIFIAMQISIEAIAWGVLSQAFFSFLVNAIPNQKLLRYSIKEQLYDILPSVGISIFMSCVVLCVDKIMPNTVIVLLLQVMIGALTYIALTYMLRKKDFMYVWNIVKTLVHRR